MNHDWDDPFDRPSEEDYEIKELQRECARKYAIPVVTQNDLNIALTLIPNGTFVMGSPLSEKGRCLGERQHIVAISRPFYISVYPITQEVYLELMGTNPSRFQGFMGHAAFNWRTSDFPVECVSWEDASRFCEKLSDIEQRKDGHYRLPTEAEWEYACRAGRDTAFGFRAEVDERYLDEKFWHGRVHGDPSTWPVGAHHSNAWGLHDMHGNVMEWVIDNHAPYTLNPSIDPMVNSSSDEHVLRGGCYGSSASACRSASRFWRPKTFFSTGTGFRIVKEVAAFAYGSVAAPEAQKIEI